MHAVRGTYACCFLRVILDCIANNRLSLSIVMAVLRLVLAIIAPYLGSGLM
jgi:DMSO/TMAO reductase YedYZ heme-binding membrane subunit